MRRRVAVWIRSWPQRTLLKEAATKEGERGKSTWHRILIWRSVSNEERTDSALHVRWSHKSYEPRPKDQLSNSPPPMPSVNKDTGKRASLVVTFHGLLLTGYRNLDSDPYESCFLDFRDGWDARDWSTICIHPQSTHDIYSLSLLDWLTPPCSEIMSFASLTALSWSSSWMPGTKTT